LSVTDPNVWPGSMTAGVRPISCSRAAAAPPTSGGLLQGRTRLGHQSRSSAAAVAGSSSVFGLRTNAR
jgi:hypothetical protein